MTTYYPFIPSQNAAPSFTPTFDGDQYQVTVPFLLFGQRLYLQCNAIDGTLIFYQALVESDPGVPIQSLTWDIETGTVNGTTAQVHGYRLGDTVALTVSGATPDVYNGLFKVLITGPMSFSYPLSLESDHGAATVQGFLSYNIDMLAAFGFKTSTLVYRNGNFEVNP